MIVLTDEQRQALATEEPPRVVDPATRKTYVLVSEEKYERLKATLEADDFADALYPHVMEVFGRQGWDDPAMDIYNDLDPRKQQ